VVVVDTLAPGMNRSRVVYPNIDWNAIADRHDNALGVVVVDRRNDCWNRIDDRRTADHCAWFK